MNAPRPRFVLPKNLIVIDLIGSVLAALGMWAVLDPDSAKALPFLAINGAPLALVILGIGMMGYAILGILRLALRPRNRPLN
jgi:hypothetical protein